MYQDDNNLYHSSYRRPEEGQNVQQPSSVDEQLRNYRNMYQNTAQSGQPQQPVQGYYQSSQPPQPPVQAPKTRKNRLGLKITALALVCALLGGAAGAGMMTVLHEREEKAENSVTVNMSARPVEEVVLHKVDGQKQLTDAENYAVNVNRAVSINCSATTNYFGQTVENASSGSGFILTKDGYIVTNHHVIEGATTVKVTLYSGETYDATIIGSDEEYDIGVIKVDVANLEPVVIGDSEKLNVGDRVLAIGNPLGELTFSQTGGMVSSVNRAINVDGTPFNMIQTDTSINPGNSGGPLMNLYGEVIGIVSAKYSSYASTSVEGLGFAIPINDVHAMINDIVSNGYVTNKPYFSITGYTVNASMAQQSGLVEGVYVFSVDQGGAAEKAGIRVGDVITKVDDLEIKSLEDLTAAKKSYSAGDTATLTIYRNGETLEVRFTFASTPKDAISTQEPVTQAPNYYYDPGFDIFDYFFW